MGWKQNSLVRIENNDIVYTPDYAVTYLVSSFMKPGDIRVAHYVSLNQPCISIVGLNGEYKILLQNDKPDTITYLVRIENDDYKVSIPGNSLAGIVVR